MKELKWYNITTVAVQDLGAIYIWKADGHVFLLSGWALPDDGNWDTPE